MAFTQDLDMPVIPGRSIGDFSLGDSLWNVLEAMRASRFKYAGTTLRWDRDDPGSPVIVDVPPGIRLVFPYTSAPHQQLLQLITVHLQPAPGTSSTDTRTRSLRLSYDSKPLATTTTASRPTPPLTRGKITQLFGPTFSRRPGTPTTPSSNRGSPSNTRDRDTDIRYPGIIFSDVAVAGDTIGSIAVVAPGEEESVRMMQFMQRLQGGLQRGEVWPVFEGRVGNGCGRVTVCEILPHQGVLLYFTDPSSDSTPPYRVQLGETTAQDLLLDLGPPARRYWKEENRFMGREARVRSESVSAQQRNEATGCWWNYFNLGLDFLVEEQGTGRITKIMIHSNIPGTAEFQRHARCPWLIRAHAWNGTDLSLVSSLEDFAPLAGNRTRSDGGNGGRGSQAARSAGGETGDIDTMRTVVLDRLEETHMDGLQGIEPSHLLALDGMVVEGGRTGIMSVLLC